MNQQGYRNLCRLVTLGYTEGFYYKPRIDKELLRELNGGLIALSGCLASEVNQAIAAGSLDRARARDGGVPRHLRRPLLRRDPGQPPGRAGARQRRADRAWRDELGLPLVATNDCHYLEPDDAKAHDVLLCIQTGKTFNDEKRWRFGTDQLYVKEPGRDARRLRAHAREAIANTLDIAKRCDLRADSSAATSSRSSHVPAGVTLEDQLERDARAGLEERLAALRKQARVDGRARGGSTRNASTPSSTIIKDMGFAGYFLIVADFTNYAKRQGIPVGPGRGSAAGSLVAYALRITDLDPLPYNLLFERFLNPERKSMPDIDMDFCFERRDEVIRYVREKYGEDHVAQIITFGTLKGKAAIKDVGRVLEFTFGETDRIAKLYPAPKQGKDFPLDQGAGDGAAPARAARQGRARGAALRPRAQARRPAAPRLQARRRHRHRLAAAGRGPAALRRQRGQRHDAVHRPARRRDRPDQVRLPRPQDADPGAQRRAPHPARARRSTIDLATLPLDDKPTYR